MPTAEATKAEETLIHVLWINAGLSCDGDSVALTAATQPSVEEIALGALPGLPQVAVHWPLIDFECGPTGGADDFLEWFFKADRGEDGTPQRPNFPGETGLNVGEPKETPGTALQDCSVEHPG